MKINDYKHANCALFRLPPIDFSKINEVIENAIVDSWKNGESAQNVLNQMLNNSSVVKTLSNQIADNMNFQRETTLRQAKEDERIKLEQTETERQAQLQKINATVVVEASEKGKIVDSLRTQLNEQNIAYSATEAKLNELRKKVKDSLYKLGGEEKIDQLLTINELVVAAPTTIASTISPTSTSAQISSSNIPAAQTSTDTVNYTTTKENTEYPVTTSDTSAQPAQIGKSIELTKEQTKIDLEKKIEDSLKESETTFPAKKRGLTYRFFKGVWDVLNYKIW